MKFIFIFFLSFSSIFSSDSDFFIQEHSPESPVGYAAINVYPISLTRSDSDNALNLEKFKKMSRGDMREMLLALFKKSVAQEAWILKQEKEKKKEAFKTLLFEGGFAVSALFGVVASVFGICGKDKVADILTIFEEGGYFIASSLSVAFVFIPILYMYFTSSKKSEEEVYILPVYRN